MKTAQFGRSSCVKMSTFHDGTPMTSAEVKGSLERTIGLGQGAAYNWDAVESIETNGDYEIVITCSSPAPSI